MPVSVLTSVGTSVIRIVTSTQMSSSKPLSNGKTSGADGNTTCTTGYDAAAAGCYVGGEKGDGDKKNGDWAHFVSFYQGDW